RNFTRTEGAFPMHFILPAVQEVETPVATTYTVVAEGDVVAKFRRIEEGYQPFFHILQLVAGKVQTNFIPFTNTVIGADAPADRFYIIGRVVYKRIVGSGERTGQFHRRIRRHAALSPAHCHTANEILILTVIHI